MENMPSLVSTAGVSPRFGGGSGLKHVEIETHIARIRVSPRFGGGSGLKLGPHTHGAKGAR